MWIAEHVEGVFGCDVVPYVTRDSNACVLWPVDMVQAQQIRSPTIRREYCNGHRQYESNLPAALCPAL